jgi:hypothetical protein
VTLIPQQGHHLAVDPYPAPAAGGLADQVADDRIEGDRLRPPLHQEPIE